MNYKQLILAGAPGTGKSFKVENEILYAIEDDNVIRTTFYQDYEYHNFIGSILPQLKDNELKYDFVPGPFTLALKKALESPNEEIYLIIEEMTRGNCAAIFGDVFQLLDRNDEGVSEYPIINVQLIAYLNKHIDANFTNIYIPSNLSIIGTINTSDQNVFPMDTAFKRRFDFEYISTNAPTTFNDFEICEGISWRLFYPKLNDIILEITGSEDKQVGPFFLKKDDRLDKLYMYLWQDVLLNGKHSKVDKIFKGDNLTLSKIINSKAPFVSIDD